MEEPEIIMIEDETQGGFTAYLKRFPEIISQGDTIEEAKKNLAATVHDVVMYFEIEFQ